MARPSRLRLLAMKAEETKRRERSVSTGDAEPRRTLPVREHRGTTDTPARDHIGKSFAGGHGGQGSRLAASRNTSDACGKVMGIESPADSDEQHDEEGASSAEDFDDPAYDAADTDSESDAGEHSQRHPSTSVAGGRSTRKEPLLVNRGAPKKREGFSVGGDDARIIELKEQGYTDTYVATRLKAEGRAEFKAKTIGSRWARLRKVREQAQDEILDDELSDWHVGEDEHLVADLKAIEEVLIVEQQKVMEKKWAHVAEMLAKSLGRKKYTAAACQERYEAVLDGTALMPIELDPDQERRRILREERIAGNRQRRAAVITDAQREQIERQQRRQEKQEAEALREQERQRVTAENQAKKDEIARQKQAKQDAIKAHHDSRRAAIDHYRAGVNWRRRKLEYENDLYGALTDGQALHGKTKAKGNRFVHGVQIKVLVDDSHSDAESGDENGDKHDDTNIKPEPRSDDEGISMARDDHKDQKVDLTETAKPVKITYVRAQVTEETLLNPRSVMTHAELTALLHKRSLPLPTARESHAQIVARLATEDSYLSTKDLTILLAAHFDKGKGSKTNKARRLQVLEAKASAAGSRGITADSAAFKSGYEGYDGKFEKLRNK